MANETLFTAKADDYASARPGYAPEAVEFVTRNFLHAGDIVADIGSGTGIFTREFLRRGYVCYAVEPNDAMRIKAEEALGADARFHSVAAPAEKTGLPDHSIHLVTAASALHWFDADAFREECRRILVPGGVVCALMNVREYDEFTTKQHDIAAAYCRGFSSLRHGYEKTERAVDAFFTEGWERRMFDFPLTYTVEKFVTRSLSSSYAPDPGTEAYERYAAALAKLAEEYSTDGKVIAANKTALFWGHV